jgi:hypothetical protein
MKSSRSSNVKALSALAMDTLESVCATRLRKSFCGRLDEINLDEVSHTHLHSHASLLKLRIFNFGIPRVTRSADGTKEVLHRP